MEETNVEIKVKKQFNWESISVYIFYGLALLLPVFFLPMAVASLSFGKAMLLYAGTALAFLFWLFTRLQKGEIKIPKSGLLLAMGGIIVAWFVSAIFSAQLPLSFMGMGYEIGTFVFFLFLGLAFFLVSMLFQNPQKVVMFYLLLLISAGLVFIFQLFHTVFGITLAPFSVFQSPTDNLIGGWNDFAIFFGFIALSSLCFFELAKFSKALKAILLASVGLSLLAMLAVNFSTAWVILAFFVLVFLVYLFSGSFYNRPAGQTSVLPGKFVTLSLVILLIVLFFILARGLLGDFTGVLNTSITEVRPSWGGTLEIVKQTLGENPVLGSGPNTFLYDWLQFKSPSINSTVFWNTRFQSGIGHLPSMLATAGILGGLALLTFLGFLIFYGMKVLSYAEDNFNKVLLITSFLGSLYLWTFTIFYAPDFFIFSLAFLVTGIFVAMLIHTGKIKVLEISFLKNPKAGFVSVLLIVILMIGAVSSLYFFFQKYWAARSYTQALQTLNIEGNLDKSEIKFARAAQIDGQDRYFRALAEIGILRMQKILSQQDVSAEILRSQFQNALGVSIQNAQKAVNINGLEPLNWMQLGRVYESVIPFNISGAGDFATQAYQGALKVSPLDPTPLLGMARAELASENIEGARARIDEALKIKGDFAAALFLLTQIEAQEGNVKEAIQRAEQTVLIAPNDTGALFQLGLLYYQEENYDGARAAFERTIMLNPSYSNARYFLGLIYEKKGMDKQAIEQFKKIQELNPGNTEVQRILKSLGSGGGVSKAGNILDEGAEPPISEETKAGL